MPGQPQRRTLQPGRHRRVRADSPAGGPGDPAPPLSRHRYRRQLPRRPRPPQSDRRTRESGHPTRPGTHTPEEAIRDNADSLLAWGLVQTRPGEDNWQRDGNDLGIKSKWNPHMYPAIDRKCGNGWRLKPKSGNQAVIPAPAPRRGRHPHGRPRHPCRQTRRRDGRLSTRPPPRFPPPAHRRFLVWGIATVDSRWKRSLGRSARAGSRPAPSPKAPAAARYPRLSSAPIPQRTKARWSRGG